MRQHLGHDVGTDLGHNMIDPLVFARRCTLHVRSRLLNFYLGLVRASCSKAFKLQNSDDVYAVGYYDFMLSMRYSIVEEAWDHSAYAKYAHLCFFVACDRKGIFDDTLSLHARYTREASRRSTTARSWIGISSGASVSTVSSVRHVASTARVAIVDLCGLWARAGERHRYHVGFSGCRYRNDTPRRHEVRGAFRNQRGSCRSAALCVPHGRQSFVRRRIPGSLSASNRDPLSLLVELALPSQFVRLALICEIEDQRNEVLTSDCLNTLIGPLMLPLRHLYLELPWRLSCSRP